jgi:hypothetical protein
MLPFARQTEPRWGSTLRAVFFQGSDRSRNPSLLDMNRLAVRGLFVWFASKYLIGDIRSVPFRHNML